RRTRVSIEVAECDAVDHSLAVVPADFLERAALPEVEINRSRQLHIAHHDIRSTISIEIGNCQCVRRPGRTGKLHRIPELASSAVEDHERSLLALLDDGQIQPAITIEVARSPNPDPGSSRSYFCRSREAALAIVPQQNALAPLAMRNEQVDCSVPVEVRRHARAR